MASCRPGADVRSQAAKPVGAATLTSRTPTNDGSARRFRFSHGENAIEPCALHAARVDPSPSPLFF
jgi:hypothetical protein